MKTMVIKKEWQLESGDCYGKWNWLMKIGYKNVK